MIIPLPYYRVTQLISGISSKPIQASNKKIAICKTVLGKRWALNKKGNNIDLINEVNENYYQYHNLVYKVEELYGYSRPVATNIFWPHL